MTMLIAPLSMLLNLIIIFFLVRRASRSTEILDALNIIARNTANNEPSAIQLLTAERLSQDKK